MTKFRVWKEKETSEREIDVGLVEFPSGGVDLCVFDEDGEVITSIVRLTREGTLYRWSDIGNVSCIKTDGQGRIVLSDTTP